MLRDPLMRVATREIQSEGKSRSTIDREVREKVQAIQALARHYENSRIEYEDLRMCLLSIGRFAARFPLLLLSSPFPVPSVLLTATPRHFPSVLLLCTCAVCVRRRQSQLLALQPRSVRPTHSVPHHNVFTRYLAGACVALPLLLSPAAHFISCSHISFRFPLSCRLCFDPALHLQPNFDGRTHIYKQMSSRKVSVWRLWAETAAHVSRTPTNCSTTMCCRA
jgi:hypothetical protein